MYKVEFDYYINDKQRIFVKAKAYDVNEYEADGLSLKFTDEDGNLIQGLIPDRDTFIDIEDRAIEYLYDCKHNQELRFD